MAKKSSREIHRDLNELFDQKSSPPNKIPLTGWKQNPGKIIKKLVIPITLGIFLSSLLYYFYPLLPLKRVKHITVNNLYTLSTFGFVVATPCLTDINQDNKTDFCVADENASLHLFDGSSGKKIFQFIADGGIIASPFAGDFNGDGKVEIAVVTEKGTVFIVNHKGEYLYKSRSEYMNEDILSKGAVMETDGKHLIFAGMRGTVWSLEGKYGLLNWMNKDSRVRGSPLFASPVIVEVNQDGIPDVVVFSQDGTVSALDGKTGNEIWYLELDTSFKASATVGRFIHNEEIFIAGLDGKLFVISPHDGEMIWTYKFKERIIASPVSGSFLHNGLDQVIVCTLKGRVHLLDVKNKKVLNTYRVEGDIPFRASPVLADLNRDHILDIICLDGEGHLYIINSKDFTLLTRIYQVSGDVSSTPLVADINKDGNIEIIVCTEKGKIHVLGLNTNPDTLFPRGKVFISEFLNDSKNHNHF